MRPRCTVPVIALASTILALAAPPAGAVPPGTFGRMFGDLPGLTSPTDAQLVALAGSMQEVVAKGQPDNNTTFVQGQFLDHDLTLDLEPSPIAPVNIKTLDNTRNALLDLDSVYGDGPGGTPQLYEADKKHLRVGVSEGTAGTIPDVRRNERGTAILGDGRNDENLVIAQFHAAFLRFHNRLIDEGMSFSKARRETQWTWQWLILNEYLPRFVGESVPRIPQRYDPGNNLDPVLPVEFAVACFRFGHSQVRNAYALNTNPGRVVFSLDPTANTLLGGRFIPADARIEWTRFFDVGGVVSAVRNVGRRIDTDIAAALFVLPIPNVVAEGGPNVLAFRNMVRGMFYGLPSYEDVALALGITPVDVAATVARHATRVRDGNAALVRHARGVRSAQESELRGG